MKTTGLIVKTLFELNERPQKTCVKIEKFWWLLISFGKLNLTGQK